MTEIRNFGNRRNRFTFCYQLDWITFESQIFKLKARALQFEWRNILIHWQQYENQYVYGYLNPLQQYFSYIVTVSFIIGEKRSTCRIPIICCKSLHMYWKFINISRISCKIGVNTMKIKNTQIFSFVHTTRFCQPLSGILKYKRLDRQIRKKTKEPKQDQLWLKSYECREQ